MRKLLVELVQKYLLQTDPRFRVGDLVIHGGNDYQYELVGIYYSFQLQPFLFIRDSADGKIFGVPMSECRSPYTN